MFTIFAKLLGNRSLKLSRTATFGDRAKLPRGIVNAAFGQSNRGLSSSGSPPPTPSTFEHPQKLLTLQLKRKRVRKAVPEHKFKAPGVYAITAYPTAEEINLELLLVAFQKELAFKAEHIQESLDVIRAWNVQHLGCEPQEVFVFREGAVVLWNIPKANAPQLLKEIRKFEQHRYAQHVIDGDAETMAYMYNYKYDHYDIVSPNKEIVLSPTNCRWERYIVSHILAATVKLSVWERQIEKYISNIEFVTEDLKYGRPVSLSPKLVLRKHGALFGLQHIINLSSFLLDRPNFVDPTHRLDRLYLELVNYFNTSKRMNVLREKLNHCLELVVLVTERLRSDQQLRLELFCILLVVVELSLETFYCLDERLFGGDTARANG